MQGRFHTAPILTASWNDPLLTAPSPKKHTTTCPFLRSFALSAPPVANGIGAPTIPLVPIKPYSGAYMCILPPRPPELPVVFPHSSASTTPAGTPFAKACPWPRCVLNTKSGVSRCEQTPTATASSPTYKCT